MIDTPDVIVDEDSHGYVQDGYACHRSVTGLLKKYGLGMDFSKIPAFVLERARQRGKAVAVGCKLIAEGRQLGPVDVRIEPYLHAFSDFWHQSGAELIETEIPRISPLGFGFTPDLVCWLNGERTIIDGKATFKVPKSVGPQTAGYQVGWNSLFTGSPVQSRAALWLKKDGKYQLKALEDPDDTTAFLDCLEADIKLTRWEAKYHE